MLFDISTLRKQLAATPLVSPYPHAVAVAIIADTFRLAMLRPPTKNDWKDLEDKGHHALWREQVGVLAHVLTASSLREWTATALKKDAKAHALLLRFFQAIEPLTAQMVLANAFRQEEFLRRWVEAVGGQVLNESARESAARLEQLDYRKAQQELKRAEQARKQEAEQRAKKLQEAAQREADARGWRE
ncbi:hypothetical protein [Pyxidicoccus xibeiensis]|uniref:hypothetical protein n=1 Tax=Pyxidicoccus xibeiensis TaxID=2906759 RepID=UPI0020A70445|nr:hypothetical protein [Pyxidicoccus xibeiensis]MCP3136639.1 hypothetical protein [Pyxidicoccus xibeiensis]